MLLSHGEMLRRPCNPAWLDVRNALEGMHKLCAALAVRRSVQRPVVLESLTRRVAGMAH